MAMFKCTECKKKISDMAETCPNCGVKVVPPDNNSSGCGTLIVGVLMAMLVVPLVFSILEPETAADAEAKVVKKELDRQKGFHCLSSWNGSHAGANRIIKAGLKDPDSFSHIETKISRLSKNGTHGLVVKFRSKNSYGGFVVTTVTGFVDSGTCKSKDLVIMES